ncbi:MAG: type II toxin-antitoxin system HipA family toxin [Achromobacter kerstersii]|uniref:type II toxin-antitoxin system HipA family toxin n=1 Tax=Achromobacter kerstersii TaxID=1353890 RepID=UPI003D07118C
MARTLYVWIYLPGQATPVVAGLFRHEEITSHAGVGYFVYGSSYLARENAVALCPTVPLNSTQYRTTANRGYFGFLLDAGPDSWGRALIDRFHGAQDALGYLRLSQGGVHTGALLFSDSASEVDDTTWLASVSELSAIQHAAAAIERGQPLPVEAEQLLRPGRSLGGARPKCSVLEAGHIWIAKFPSVSDSPDLPDNARQEYAMYALARKAGIDVPECQLIETAQGAVFLSRRFDVTVLPEGGFGRLRYASARSALEVPDLPPAAHGSYPGVARQMPKWCEEPARDRRQWFRRLAFNIATTNTDDHELNHGFFDGDDVLSIDTLQLAPAFDLVPSVLANQRIYQGMLVGDEGALSTFRNAVSSAPQFSLTESQAWEIITEVWQITHEGWRGALADAGAGAAQIQRLAPAFERHARPH